MDARTSMGPVHLTVSDAERLSAFYVRHLGMHVSKRDAAQLWLGTGERDLVVLTESRNASRPFGTTGLYHFALLVSSRIELARSLRLLLDTGTPLQGASDHGVSEALYLADPDGNGIEIYRDRPRADWPRVQGALKMGVDPLDLDGLLREIEAPSKRAAAETRPHVLDSATVMGHVHLQVANLAVAEAFYCGVLGFDVTQRYGRGALFVSAGGYHHHLGLNTWAGVGLPPSPPGSLGLRRFVVQLAGGAELDAVRRLLREGNVDVADEENGAVIHDPSGNAVLLAA